MIIAGRLNRNIDLYTVTSTNTKGHVSTSRTYLKSIKVEVIKQDVKSDQKEDTNQVNYTYKFRARKDAFLTISNELKFEGEFYDILNIEYVDRLQKEMIITVERNLN